MKTVLIAGTVGVLVVGCGGKAEPGGGGAPSGGSDLKGQVFVSQSVTEQGKPRALVQGTAVQLEFTEEGTLVAKAGCNTMSGQVDTADARIAATGLAITEIGCDPALHEQDNWLVGVINSKPGWEFDGTTLKVKSTDSEIVLTAKKSPPLEGTTWAVDTIVEKDTARPSDVPAWARFEGGNLVVEHGCNTLSGPYEATTGTITFGQMGTTLAGCPQENTIYPVLQGEVTYKIHNDSLSLTHPSGLGLQLRAMSLAAELEGKEFVADNGYTLRFKDGRLTANAGCNDMSAPASTDGDKLVVVSSFGKTRKACEPALMEQEQQLEVLLKSNPQWTPDGLKVGEIRFRKR